MNVRPELKSATSKSRLGSVGRNKIFFEIKETLVFEQLSSFSSSRVRINRPEQDWKQFIEGLWLQTSGIMRILKAFLTRTIMLGDGGGLALSILPFTWRI